MATFTQALLAAVFGVVRVALVRLWIWLLTLEIKAGTAWLRLQMATFTQALMAAVFGVVRVALARLWIWLLEIEAGGAWPRKFTGNHETHTRNNQ